MALRRDRSGLGAALVGAGCSLGAGCGVPAGSAVADIDEQAAPRTGRGGSLDWLTARGRDTWQAGRDRAREGSAALWSHAEHGARDLGTRARVKAAEGASWLTDAGWRGVEDVGRGTHEALVGRTRELERWLGEGGGAPERLSSLWSRGRRAGERAAAIAAIVDRFWRSDLAVIPVVRRLDGREDRSQADLEIARMPRVEVIEGLTIGLQRVDDHSLSGHARTSRFLVTWRAGDWLVGVMVTAERELSYEQLAAELPALIELASRSLDEP